MREKTQIDQENKNQIGILNKPTFEQQTLQPKEHCSSYSPSLQLNSEYPKFSKPKEYKPIKLTQTQKFQAQTQKIKHKNTRNQTQNTRAQTQLDMYDIGSDEDTYRRSWSFDRKHRYEEKRYANNDFYKGYWKRNVQDEQGCYIWKNGNKYEGEWKNGVILGHGVLLWANGNCYSREWENGKGRR